ncbi:MAG: hypothetical protein S4CHLAM102_11400 [Chlamydiia bacterium]|nr:hypothetical protein [Chlamydiia bacterium]
MARLCGAPGGRTIGELEADWNGALRVYNQNWATVNRKFQDGEAEGQTFSITIETLQTQLQTLQDVQQTVDRWLKQKKGETICGVPKKVVYSWVTQAVGTGAWTVAGVQQAVEYVLNEQCKASGQQDCTRNSWGVFVFYGTGAMNILSSWAWKRRAEELELMARYMNISEAAKSGLNTYEGGLEALKAFGKTGSGPVQPTRTDVTELKKLIKGLKDLGLTPEARTQLKRRLWERTSEIIQEDISHGRPVDPDLAIFFYKNLSSEPAATSPGAPLRRRRPSSSGHSTDTPLLALPPPLQRSEMITSPAGSLGFPGSHGVPGAADQPPPSGALRTPSGPVGGFHDGSMRAGDMHQPDFTYTQPAFHVPIAPAPSSYPLPGSHHTVSAQVVPAPPGGWDGRRAHSVSPSQAAPMFQLDLPADREPPVEKLIEASKSLDEAAGVRWDDGNLVVTHDLPKAESSSTLDSVDEAVSKANLSARERDFLGQVMDMVEEMFADGEGVSAEDFAVTRDVEYDDDDSHMPDLTVTGSGLLKEKKKKKKKDKHDEQDGVELGEIPKNARPPGSDQQVGAGEDISPVKEKHGPIQEAPEGTEGDADTKEVLEIGSELPGPGPVPLQWPSFAPTFGPNLPPGQQYAQGISQDPGQGFDPGTAPRFVPRPLQLPAPMQQGGYKLNTSSTTPIIPIPPPGFQSMGDGQQPVDEKQLEYV